MTQFDHIRSRPVVDYGVGEATMFSFFNMVYAWMAAGIALTAIVAWFVAHSPLVYALANPGAALTISLGLFALAWFVQSQAGRIGAPAATALFLAYASGVGVLISPIWIVYPVETLGSALLLTAGTFGVMSVYGFVTKRDLSGIGSIMVMCVIGVFFASLVNLFLANEALSWLITYAVLILFIGITAYQTQMLKGLAEQLRYQPHLMARYAIVGSLVLYISFINLFLAILRILDRR